MSSFFSSLDAEVSSVGNLFDISRVARNVVYRHFSDLSDLADDVRS